MSKDAPRRSGRVDVLVAGGGTAGHIIPALNVAQALVASGYDKSDIHFVGSARGMESTLIPNAGFTVTLLPGRGIVRRLSFKNVGAIGGLIAACALSMRVLFKLRPKVVVSVGGYASIPPTIAAFFFRVPIVVVTIDAVPGAANRLIGRIAKKNAVAYPNTPLRNAEVTGAPVRNEVLALDLSDDARATRRKEHNIDPEATFVVITGGSLGARRLNDVGIGLARTLVNRTDVVMQHVAGARDFERVRSAMEGLDLGTLDYRLSAYEDHLYELFACADLVIARAGASTVAELAVIGTPSILVPLPNAPSDHQRKNAEVLANAGAATIVNDGDATPEAVVLLLSSFSNDKERQVAMHNAALKVGSREGSLRIAQLINGITGATHGK